MSIKGVIANVRSGAIDAMASQIGGSAENSTKRRIDPRNDNVKKIEDLFARFDATNLVFSLVDDLRSYLESIASTDNSSFAPAIDALIFASSTGKQQLVKMRESVNNTKVKKRAE